MLLAFLCMGIAALAVTSFWPRPLPPLDAEELRLIRRFSDELRREQIHPFE